MSDLSRAVHEISKHAPNYQLAEDYYWGKVGELFTSPAVRRALRGQVGGFDVNLARRPVDAVLDRMKIVSVPVANDDGATRLLVDQVWTPNRLGRYSKQIHWAALVYGDAYLIVWPNEDATAVDVHYNSPVNTRVFYDEEDPRRKRYAAKMWRATTSSGQERTRVNLYYADRVERYISKSDATPERDEDFEAFTTDPADAWPIENPFGELPVFHFRTSEPYGHPEHEGAYGPQNAITKLSATQMATIDFQGFPQRYALMTEGADDLIDWGDDDVEGSSAVEPGSRDSSLTAAPGELWKLPGASKVGQFDPANVDAFLKPIGLYTRLMASATATPLRFFDPAGQIPSGEALRADEAPLASRITDREDDFTEVWSEALVFALGLLGVKATTVDVKWAPVQFVNDEEGWKTIVLKLGAGVPFDQVMTEAGYASDLVAQWAVQRDAAQPTPEPDSPAPSN